MNAVYFLLFHEMLFHVIVDDISVTYIHVTTHRCAGRLKKFDHHQTHSNAIANNHSVGFFNIPVQALTGLLFFIVILINRTPSIPQWDSTFNFSRSLC